VGPLYRQFFFCCLRVHFVCCTAATTTILYDQFVIQKEFKSGTVNVVLDYVPIVAILGIVGIVSTVGRTGFWNRIVLIEDVPG
jgi:hypothetical protein